jgi:hypothetical protein
MDVSRASRSSLFRWANATSGFGQEETQYLQCRGRRSSVLMRARWKRIILGELHSFGHGLADTRADEGHVAGDKSSNAMRLASSLSVERRWVVSGSKLIPYPHTTKLTVVAPTKHLQQGGEAESEPVPFNASRSRPPIRHVPSTGNQWSTRDIDDATRIGVMIGGFLGAEPFRSSTNFQEMVTSLLRAKTGPKFRAVRRMRYLMSSMMVKHG